MALPDIRKPGRTTRPVGRRRSRLESAAPSNWFDRIYRGGQLMAQMGAEIAWLSSGVKIASSICVRIASIPLQREKARTVEVGWNALCQRALLGGLSMLRQARALSRDLLGLLNDSQHLVFVHFLRARLDRTGTLIACYRIAHG